MSKYVVDHHLEDERARPALTSQRLDPMHRRHVRDLVAGLARGDAIRLIGPDFLPVSVAEPPEVRAFWDGWLTWSRDHRTDTIVELREGLVASGRLDDRLIDAFLAHCADPAWWTQTIAFAAVQARAGGG